VAVSDKQPPKTTHLRDYYAALGALQEEEQTLLAEAHAENPKPLIHRFKHSVRSAEKRSVDPAEPFHESKRKAPAEPPVPLDELKRTIDFASHLVHREMRVDQHPELSFAYVDREIFPARTEGSDRMPARTLDLLLVNSEDGTPIVGELKIRDDSLTYFALIQALMHVAELAVESQRQRLQKHYEAAGFSDFARSPQLDLYVIAYEPPERTYGERSLRAAQSISEQLLRSPDVSKHLRRIAFLEAQRNGDALLFSPTGKALP
jgi:hypothetical protein